MLNQHDIQIRVRYCETDAMGYLHHSHYLSYFEMGRTELYRVRGGDYRKMEEQGLFFVVARIECKYQRPARFDDLLTLRTTITNASFAKLEHDYHVYRDGECLAQAHSVLACVDRNGAIQRIPDVIGGSA